jgi:4-hydroxy-tetrahydrodipicolinate synthase
MQFDHLIQRLRSITAIPVTPFAPDGQVDWSTYSRLVGRLVDDGIRVITPNGNTGEFYALSRDECNRAVEVADKGAGERALLLPGVGYDVATAVEMGRFAEQAGAGGVMIHQPVHPYQSPDGWLAYHQAIADALPNLGIVPYIRAAWVSGALVRRLADACRNVIGVKYAVPNPQLFSAVVQEVGPHRLAWVCGLAEGWAPFFWVGGARGFTSGLVNVQAALSLDMLRCLEAGDYMGAMRVWVQVKPFEDLRARRDNANNVSVVKEALAQLGVCTRTVRPPISELPPDERAEVAAILTAWDLVGR